MKVFSGIREFVTAALSAVKVGYYRLRLRHMTRHDVYVRQQWLTERMQARQLD